MDTRIHSLDFNFRAPARVSRFIATSAMSMLALIALGGTAQAGVNLITNGTFATGSPISTEILNGSTLPGWYSSDAASGFYNYVYLPNQVTPSDPNGAYTTQQSSQYQCPSSAHPGVTGWVCLYAPESGPNGGNFVALDADPSYRNALTQSVSGLTPGTFYTLSFDWGGAEYTTRTGPTTENIIVSLGGETQNATNALIPGGGGLTGISNNAGSFTGWQSDTLTFQATSATEVLSFLANGTPGGEPPVVVLADVSLIATPEPGYWMVMVPGLGLLFVAARKRVKSARHSV